MKDFMVVYAIEGENAAKFYDSYGDAKQAMMDIECGCDGYAEIYVRQDNGHGHEYVFLEA